MAIPETPAARLRALRQRWEADRSSRVFLQLAEEYRRQGQPLEALPVLEEGLRHHTASIAGQVALGRCRLEVGQAEGAAAVLEKVVERDPTQMVAYRTLVDAYIRLGAATEARDRLSHYGQLNPQDPEIDSLGQQIEALERASIPVASPERTTLDIVEAGEARPAFAPAEPAPSAEPAGFASGTEGEAVATPWPSGSASPADLPANRWSTATFEPGWISPSVERAPGPTSFEPARPETEQAAPTWSSGWSTNDSPTQMFALPELPSAPAAEPRFEPQPAPAPESEPEPEPLQPVASSRSRATQSLADSEFETVLFDLAEVQSLVAEEPPPMATGMAQPPEPQELETPGESAEPEEPVPGAEDAQQPRSWSIGESEIVFSLPATPLLRELVDLAAVPWRPLAAPSWSKSVAEASPLTPAAPPALRVSPTLAQLYLDQGHPTEAEELFEEVLRQEPGNPIARAGLERAQRERTSLNARALLDGFEDDGAGLSAKQAYVLRRWATLLREAHRRDAP